MQIKSKHYILSIFITILISIPVSVGTANTEWKSLSKGLEYTKINVNPGVIHAFRIDPEDYKFGVVTAKELGKNMSSVESMAKRSRAIVAINGGFFTPEYESLGLLVSDGKTLNPLKKTSWWSIFYVKGETPYIAHTNSFKNDSSILMAVQSGPRLVVSGSIPKLKSSFAERSAICITSKRKVILVATEGLAIQPNDFAEYLRMSEAKEGLGCHTALNLDGGRSTQIYAKVGSFKLNVPGINRVTNAVVVHPK